MTQTTPKMLEERRRTVDAKIARLRLRLKDAPLDSETSALRAILAGVLDLLDDEL